jgi:phosphatidylserine/phosphatidylglycerophosphate/cardiolipin synthase-like enzyme
MAKFLATTGVSYHLEELIKNADKKLFLISPYLKLNERIKDLLGDKVHQKDIDIQLVYGKNERQADENWIKSIPRINLGFCKNLHAKCYLNDYEAIITSMNLYEFSEVNNNEMGIYVEKKSEPVLYSDILQGVEHLIRISEFHLKESKPAYKIVPTANKVVLSKEKKNEPADTGYCIRTGTKIPFNVEKPLSREAYKKWNVFGDPDYKEHFCHFSGEPSNGETSVNKPILKKNWMKAKELYGLS